jgi:hypothetical protein
MCLCINNMEKGQLERRMRIVIQKISKIILELKNILEETSKLYYMQLML